MVTLRSTLSRKRTESGLDGRSPVRRSEKGAWIGCLLAVCEPKSSSQDFSAGDTYFFFVCSAYGSADGQGTLLLLLCLQLQESCCSKSPNVKFCISSDIWQWEISSGIKEENVIVFNVQFISVKTKHWSFQNLFKPERLPLGQRFFLTLRNSQPPISITLSFEVSQPSTPI